MERHTEQQVIEKTIENLNQKDEFEESLELEYDELNEEFDIDFDEVIDELFSHEIDDLIEDQEILEEPDFLEGHIIDEMWIDEDGINTLHPFDKIEMIEEDIDIIDEPHNYIEFDEIMPLEIYDMEYNDDFIDPAIGIEDADLLPI